MKLARMVAVVAALLLFAGVAEAQSPAPVSEGEARALVERWLASQNEGQLPAYSAAYAQKFYGVRRSGPRVATFDRAGWLEDRSRMFKKKMVVEARDLSFGGGSGAVVVTFTQTWASGSYKDVGMKQLVVVREGDAVGIAREEMLSSEVVGGTGEKTPLALPLLANVTLVDGAPHVILAVGADQAWAEDTAPRYVSSSPAVATKPAASAKLPPELARWKGRKVTLGATGASCEGSVRDLVVVTRFDAHFGAAQTWSGSPEMDGDGTPMPKDAIAKEIWSTGHGHAVLLLGRVEPVGTGCSDGLWARDAEEPAVTDIAVPVEDRSFDSAALAALRGLSAYKRVQRQYETDAQGEKTPEWTAYEGTAPQVSVLRAPSGRTFVTVTAQAGSGCGDFAGELWGVWEATGPERRLVLLTDEASPGELFRPAAAMDADGDGHFELISRDGVVRMVGPVLQRVRDTSVPSYDCPC